MSRVIVYDSTAGTLSKLWGAYAKVQRLRGYRVIAATSWDDAIDKLPQEEVYELQAWGHGEPGHPLMGGKAIKSEHLSRLSRWIDSDNPALVWFRMCSVFFGQKGQAFARHATQLLGCRVAAHTRVIGNGAGWQSGLYVATPGVEPDWPINNNTDEFYWRNQKSSRTAPRTVHCTTMSVPPKWLAMADFRMQCPNPDCMYDWDGLYCNKCGYVKRLTAANAAEKE